MQTNSRAWLKSSFVGNWNINSLSRVVYIMIRLISRLVRKSLSTALDTTLHFSCRKIHCVGKKNGLLQSRTMPFWFCFFRHVTRGAVTPRVEWRQLSYQRIIRSSDNKLPLMFAGKGVHKKKLFCSIYSQFKSVLSFTSLFCSHFRAKLKEIKAGADGFLVFDPDLVQPLIQVSNHHFTRVDKSKYVLHSHHSTFHCSFFRSDRFRWDKNGWLKKRS